MMIKQMMNIINVAYVYAKTERLIIKLDNQSNLHISPISYKDQDTTMYVLGDLPDILGYYRYLIKSTEIHRLQNIKIHNIFFNFTAFNYLHLPLLKVIENFQLHSSTNFFIEFFKIKKINVDVNNDLNINNLIILFGFANLILIYLTNLNKNTNMNFININLIYSWPLKMRSFLVNQFNKKRTQKNKHIPIQINGINRINFNYLMDLRGYQEIFINRVFKNPIDFRTQLNDNFLPSPRKDRYINDLNRLSIYKKNINYFDINGRYRYILKTHLFRSQSADYNDLIYVESSDLNQYNYLIYREISHDEKILNQIKTDFNLNNLSDIYNFNKNQIQQFKKNYPSIYAPYFRVNTEKSDNVRLILDNKIVFKWLTKSESLYALNIGYNIKPLFGYNRLHFSSIGKSRTDLINNYQINRLNQIKNLCKNVTIYNRIELFSKQLNKDILNMYVGMSAKKIVKNTTLGMLMMKTHDELMDHIQIFSNFNEIDISILRQHPKSLPFLKHDYLFNLKGSNLLFYEVVVECRLLIYKHIISALQQGQDVFFSNIDSIVTSADLKTSTELGQLKNVFKNENIQNLYISSLGNYIIQTEKNFNVKGVLKYYKSFQSTYDPYCHTHQPLDFSRVLIKSTTNFCSETLPLLRSQSRIRQNESKHSFNNPYSYIISINPFILPIRPIPLLKAVTISENKKLSFLTLIDIKSYFSNNLIEFYNNNHLSYKIQFHQKMYFYFIERIKLEIFITLYIQLKTGYLKILPLPITKNIFLKKRTLWFQNLDPNVNQIIIDRINQKQTKLDFIFFLKRLYYYHRLKKQSHLIHQFFNPKKINILHRLSSFQPNFYKTISIDNYISIYNKNQLITLINNYYKINYLKYPLFKFKLAKKFIIYKAFLKKRKQNKYKYLYFK